MPCRYFLEHIVTCGAADIDMKQILFLALSTFAVALGVDLQRGVRAKFGLGDGNGTQYYFPIPLFVSDAVAQGWAKTPRPEGPLPSLDLYCAPGLSMCGLYDDTGYIAGTQVAVQKSRFLNSKLDWNVQGYSTWTVNGVEYWAMSQYFVNEQFFKQSRAVRLASRDNTTTLQMDSVWMTSNYGKLLEIPVAENKLSSLWSKQNCFTGMGLHYYYNLTNTVCTSDLVQPWFIMYYQGELVGNLWSSFGDYAAIAGERDWFERPNRQLIKMNFPDAPECHLQLTEHTVAMHQWFINNPWDTVCANNKQ